jgi:hypothetical protein
MSMTKKDYEMVAKALNAVLWHHESDPATAMAAIRELTQAFTRDNEERFKPQTFIEACCQSRTPLPHTVARSASTATV